MSDEELLKKAEEKFKYAEEIRDVKWAIGHALQSVALSNLVIARNSLPEIVEQIDPVKFRDDYFKNDVEPNNPDNNWYYRFVEALKSGEFETVDDRELYTLDEIIKIARMIASVELDAEEEKSE